MKKTIVTLFAVATMLMSPTSRAWTLLPTVPDPVTWFAHAAFGFGVAWALDTFADIKPVSGVAITTGIGVAKELTDVNFSTPDALFWGVGAALYYYQKDMITCPDVNYTLHRDDWYVTHRRNTLEECPTGD